MVFGRFLVSNNIEDNFFVTCRQVVLFNILFLPTHYEKIDFLCQKPSGQIILFITSYIFMLKFPPVRLAVMYPKHISVLCPRSNMKIHGAVISYTRRTNLIFNHFNIWNLTNVVSLERVM